MDEKDFEGTLVLERLAEIGRVEDFFDAAQFGAPHLSSLRKSSYPERRASAFKRSLRTGLAK